MLDKPSCRQPRNLEKLETGDVVLSALPAFNCANTQSTRSSRIVPYGSCLR